MKHLKKGLLLALALMLTVTMAEGMDSQAAAKPKAVKATVKGASASTGSTYYTIKGKKLTVKASVTPKNASKKVTFKSSKKSVATVSTSGKVTAKKKGTAYITVTTKTGKKKCKVKIVVNNKPSSSKKVNKVTIKTFPSTLTVGQSSKMTYSVVAKKNKKPSVKTVVFTSSNTAVATVSTKGVITAKKAGTAKITVKAVDGSNKKATRTVTVKAKPVTPTPTPAPKSYSVSFKLNTEAIAAKVATGEVSLTLNGTVKYTGGSDLLATLKTVVKQAAESEVKGQYMPHETTFEANGNTYYVAVDAAGVVTLKKNNDVIDDEQFKTSFDNAGSKDITITCEDAKKVTKENVEARIASFNKLISTVQPTKFTVTGTATFNNSLGNATVNISDVSYGAGKVNFTVEDKGICTDKCVASVSDAGVVTITYNNVLLKPDLTHALTSDKVAQYITELSFK